MTPALHFVGFRDDAYNRAIRVFGRPDFVHHDWDRIAVTDVAPGDTVIFAKEIDWKRFLYNQPMPYSRNDSEQF